MFCQKCGKELPEGSATCPNCNFEFKRDIDNEKQNKDLKASKNEDYKKYVEKNKRIKIFAIASQIFSLFIIFSLIFLPIYTCKYEATLNDLESIDKFESIIKNDGFVIENFSAYDDMVKLIAISKAVMNSDKDSTTNSIESTLNIAILLEAGLMLIFEMLIALGILISMIIQIYQTCRELCDINIQTMLKFNELSKSGVNSSKENVFKKQSIFNLVIYAILDILYTKIITLLSDIKIFDTNTSARIRYMQNFTGFSSFVFIIIFLVLGYILTSSIKKKEEKGMLVDIISCQNSK